VIESELCTEVIITTTLQLISSIAATQSLSVALAAVFHERSPYHLLHDRKDPEGRDLAQVKGLFDDEVV